MENQDLEGQIKWLKNIVKENSKTLFTNGSHYKRQLKVIKTDLEEISTLEKLNQLLSTPPTEDKVPDADVIMEQMYKEFEWNVGKPKLVHIGKPAHMWEQMFKSSVKHALLQIAKNQFAQT